MEGKSCSLQPEQYFNRKICLGLGQYLGEGEKFVPYVWFPLISTWVLVKINKNIS